MCQCTVSCDIVQWRIPVFGQKIDICSIVDQHRGNLGEAFEWNRMENFSQFYYQMRNLHGLPRKADQCRAVLPSSSTASRLAPLLTNKSAIFSLPVGMNRIDLCSDKKIKFAPVCELNWFYSPWAAAWINGVSPFLLAKLTFAPRLINTSMIFLWPKHMNPF